MTVVPAFDYATFITMPQGFDDISGPWGLYADATSAVMSYKSAYSGSSTRMLVTSRYSSTSTIDIYPYIIANVSIDPGRYANPRSIPFTFSYLPYFTRIGESVQPFSMRSTVGLSTWKDSFYTSTYEAAPSTSNRVSHSDSLSISGWTSGIVYVTLSLYIGVTDTTDSFLFMIEDAHFQIIADAVTSTVVTTTPAGPAGPTGPTQLSTTVDPGAAIAQNNAATSSNSPSGGVIAGAVIGVVALLALLLGLFFLWRRRRNQQSKNAKELEDAQLQKTAQPAPYPDMSQAPPAQAQGFHKYDARLVGGRDSTGPLLYGQDAIGTPPSSASPTVSPTSPRSVYTAVGYTPPSSNPGHVAPNSINTGGPPAMVHSAEATYGPANPTRFSQ